MRFATARACSAVGSARRWIEKPPRWLVPAGRKPNSGGGPPLATRCHRRSRARGRLQLRLQPMTAALALGTVDPPRLAHRSDRANPRRIPEHLRRTTGPRRASLRTRDHRRAQRRGNADETRRPPGTACWQALAVTARHAHRRRLSRTGFRGDLAEAGPAQTSSTATSPSSSRTSSG
jgi:hypothetical protein